MLELKIHEKNIEVKNPSTYNRGTVGAEVKITFDDFWADFEKTVVFKRCYDALSEPVNVIVNDMDVTVDIPPEILAESGKFKIGVFGLKDGIVQPTLYSEEFNSLYATDTKGKSPDTYTPTEIEQLRLSKQDKLTAGDGIDIKGNVISAKGGGGTGETTDYKNLKNKPQINGIELNGDLSADKLSLVDKKIFDNAVGDIETALDELHNYAQSLIGGAE